jgi:uncharacterized protein (TIGR03083 family)
MTPAELYADVRLRISDLVRDLPDGAVTTPVPGCPGWTIHDVLAHATGVVADVNAGQLENAASDPWTGAQVDARRGVPTADVLAEWAQEAATFEPNLDTWPKALSRTLLIDLVTHEHDIRGALRDTGGRDTEAYGIARKGFAVGLAKALDERGLPGLRLVAPGFEFDAGAVEPRATVTAPDAHEFFRAFAGRRGRKQVLSWDWGTDPEPYLAVVNHFGEVPDEDVVEE